MPVGRGEIQKCWQDNIENKEVKTKGKESRGDKVRKDRKVERNQGACVRQGEHGNCRSEKRQ